MQDPEKVERFDTVANDRGQPPMIKRDEGLYVRASDYDQLLADYKEAISQIRVLIKERDALVPKPSETDPAPPASA